MKSTLRRTLFALSAVAVSALASCAYQDPFALPPLGSSGNAQQSSPYYGGGGSYYGSRYYDPRFGYYYAPGYPGYYSSYGALPYPSPGYAPYPRGPYCIDANRDGRCDGQRPHGSDHNGDADNDNGDGQRPGPGHGQGQGQGQGQGHDRGRGPGGQGPGDDGRDHGPRGNATGRSPMEQLNDVARQVERQPPRGSREAIVSPPAGGQAVPRTRPAADPGRPAVRSEPPPVRVRPVPDVADRSSGSDKTPRGETAVAPTARD